MQAINRPYNPCRRKKPATLETPALKAARKTAGGEKKILFCLVGLRKMRHLCIAKTKAATHLPSWRFALRLSAGQLTTWRDAGVVDRAALEMR